MSELIERDIGYRHGMHGKWGLRTIIYDGNDNTHYYDYPRDILNHPRRDITLELSLFPTMIFHYPAKPSKPFDFASTAEEIKDPPSLPTPPKGLPRGSE